MNSRRVHAFVREHFPAFDGSAHAWINLADERGPRRTEVEKLLTSHLGAGEVIVEVRRDLGLASTLPEAVSFICEHIGQAEIRATNRGCSGFVVIGVNGAGCGWRVPQEPAAGD